MATIKIEDYTFHLPEEGDGYQLWQTFFEEMEKVFKIETARLIWLKVWQKRGSISFTTNTSFNQWSKKKGLEVSNTATRAFATFSDIGENVLNTGANFTKLISFVPYIAAIGGVGVLGLLIYGTVKGNIDPIKIATSVTPVGRAASLGTKLLQK